MCCSPVGLLGLDRAGAPSESNRNVQSPALYGRAGADTILVSLGAHAADQAAPGHLAAGGGTSGRRSWQPTRPRGLYSRWQARLPRPPWTLATALASARIQDRWFTTHPTGLHRPRSRASPRVLSRLRASARIPADGGSRGETCGLLLPGSTQEAARAAGATGLGGDLDPHHRTASQAR